MNISPISFKGRFVYNYNESTLKNSQYWHKNSSIEDTIGSYHSNKTQQAYFADPMEKVSDKIKEQADFIVYDNEPAYPHLDEVKENYLGTLRRNFREAFEEVRLYFYRREMGGHADINEAKGKQSEAANLTYLYDKAGDLRYKKETGEDKVKELEKEKSALTAELKSVKRDLSNKQEARTHVNKQIQNLKNLQTPYEELTAQIKSGIPNEIDTNFYIQEKSKSSGYSMESNARHMQNQIESLKSTVNKLETLKTEYSSGISALKNRIKSIEERIALTQKNIELKNSFIEEYKTKLAPLFEELKNFYAKQGIKNIKRGL